MRRRESNLPVILYPPFFINLLIRIARIHGRYQYWNKLILLLLHLFSSLPPLKTSFLFKYRLK